ncbi:MULTISPECIES: hypothetical protein [unclassified Shinella]|uniref:hypothetical protein n=1 Tax=unclassified Shinella TaxID=2643062 RepID=UPI00225D0DBC|nr:MULTISPECIES: hypothetical protein [unclassified Shinella]MCO5140884.1 hypothetical protein [Shinella sp.]MDC7256425.1 hypothetical protein [Shinella sp. YE25]CAI0339291.1 conserved hypothetical protein [Rhizobiaceae bacterium]CAK7257701.1 conserved protein of unknown function [Shinella sp. WSC3-e]
MANGFLGLDSDALMAISAGLLSGRSTQEQLGNAATGLIGARKEARQRNMTMEMLGNGNPQLVQAVQAGLLSPADAFTLHYKQQLADKEAQLKAQRPSYMAVGGRVFNENTGDWIDPPGGVAKKLPAVADEYEYAKSQGFGGSFMDYQASKRRAGNTGADPYETRRAAAEANGLTPDNPAYQSFILTGKMPREDQSPLTATDKKAILEADDMVAANENAITALDQAISINDKANQGFGASTRGAFGNALPNILLPDFVSSPESSAATAEYDNLVIGQALQSLKSIFGAAPTEGERKILMEIQGSASLPKNVRLGILERAKALAERRLEFNRQRSESLRGGSFYKPGGGQAQKGNRTSAGVQWSIEP